MLKSSDNKKTDEQESTNPIGGEDSFSVDPDALQHSLYCPRLHRTPTDKRFQILQDNQDQTLDKLLYFAPKKIFSDSSIVVPLNQRH